MKKTPHVLIVENDEEWQDRLRGLAESLGYTVRVAASWKTAWRWLQRSVPERLILDLHLGISPDDGVFLLDALHWSGNEIPTAVVSYAADSRRLQNVWNRYAFVKLVVAKRRLAELSGSLFGFLSPSTPVRRNFLKSTNVFVIHGRDLSARERVVRILYELKTHPVILESEAAGGRTIIELVEGLSNVPFCIAIMTGDDVGHLKDDLHAAKRRARQNVVLEVGYMMAKLGRDHVLLLNEEIELPSDLHGVRWLSLDSNNDKLKLAIARELQASKVVDFQL